MAKRNVSLILDKDLIDKIDNDSKIENRSRSYMVNERLKEFYKSVTSKFKKEQGGIN